MTEQQKTINDRLQFRSTEITLFRYLYAQILGNVTQSFLSRAERPLEERDFELATRLAKAMAIEAEKTILEYEEELKRGE